MSHDQNPSTETLSAAQVVQEDKRGSGRLIGNFLFRYFKAMDSVVLWVPGILLLTAAETGLSQLFRYLLSLWSSHAPSEWVWLRVGVEVGRGEGAAVRGLVLVFGVVVLGIFVRTVAWSLGLVFLSKGALKLHDRAVVALGSTPVTFFDAQPTGRLLARLSDDYEKISREIPNYVVDILSGTAELLWAVVLVLVGAPVLLPVALPCGWAYLRHQAMFVNTSRELQRLNKVLEAPSWSLFTESVSLSAAQCIRVHGRGAEFAQLLAERQKLFGHATLVSSRLTRWLNVRLKLISEFFALTVALVAIAALANDSIALAACAFLMSLSIGLDGTMQWVTRAVSLLEPAAVSIERVHQLSALPNESSALRAPLDIVKLGSREDILGPWSEGVRWKLEVRDLQVSYRPDLPMILDGVSFDVTPGQRIGIIGRTGAGKTTIFQALYQMVHQRSGTVSVRAMPSVERDLPSRSRTEAESLLDVSVPLGQSAEDAKVLDLGRIPVEVARSFFTIVPQDPVLFSGTIRDNLDRLGVYEDRTIWDILEQVELAEFVAGLPGALSYPLREAGSNLSAGERQLLCIARAALNPVRNRLGTRVAPAFVLLDEATANVDHRTDARVGKALNVVFHGSAVLIIAHRLETVASCDKVMALSNGKVVAEGPPREVLETIRFHSPSHSGEGDSEISQWL